MTAEAQPPGRGARGAHRRPHPRPQLHAMAAQIGIPRRAFQNRRSGAHYVDPAPLRLQAIALGATASSRHTDGGLV
ncbi:DUF4031 domain-containing protein, partial [Stenotrophomonas sp. SrG]|uniref:DUF4031 domain-containing protein n=1 Tax=Stenotrophomonas sp. SrG TaxID=3414430 RepID=UPI003CF06658